MRDTNTNQFTGGPIVAKKGNESVFLESRMMLMRNTKGNGFDTGGGSGSKRPVSKQNKF